MHLGVYKFYKPSAFSSALAASLRSSVLQLQAFGFVKFVDSGACV